MAELDQAPATTTADTPGQKPAGELRPGSGDSQTRYPNGVTAADTDPSYYDGDMQAALAANTTPTRQQAARDAAASDQQAAGSEGRDGATATSHDPPPSSHDADIDAILHENDNKPDPRTRQQAARDAAASTTPAKERPAASDQQTRSGPDPSTGTVSETTATPADARSPHGQAAPEVRTPTGHDQATDDLPITIMQASAEMRTLGDDTPTGIGLKPTGGELEEMDSDRLSRADRFRKTFYKQADDINDVTEKNAAALEGFLGHRPAGGEAAVTGHTVIEAPQPPPADVGSIATAGLVLGILADRGIHWARQRKKRG
jgi:hypothetical protein